MNDLRLGYDMVWEWRKANEHWFPTPPPVDCLAYAITEIGEAIDADLRSRRVDDVRNNGYKEHSVSSEMADCAFMLYSALEHWEDYPPMPEVENCVDALPTLIATTKMIAHACDMNARWKRSVHGALWYIAYFLGADTPLDDFLPTLRSRFERIEAKRKPETA